MKLRKHILPKNIRESIYLLFSSVMIAFSYWFFIFVILTFTYPIMTFWYLFHTFIWTFFIINITGNVIYMILQDCSVLKQKMPSTKPSPDWNYCNICETITPPRSFHCKVCGICISKRDHHCEFVGCCIGHENQRYFLLFLLHLSAASLYAFYFHTIFVMAKTTFSLVSFIKLIFPILLFFMGLDISFEIIYIALYVFNIIIMILSLMLFFCHLKSMLEGKTVYEMRHNIIYYNSGSLKENIVQVAGYRWYLTLFFPFVDSKLPQDGINWMKYNMKND